MGTIRRILLAASFASGAVAQTKLVGELGQAVLGCVCKGGKTKDAYCGYHFHSGAQPSRPWCRTKYGCGTKSAGGSWTFCDARGVERRRAENGKLYTSKEFKDFYGKEGRKNWKKASPFSERRLGRDQRAYNVKAFRDYYLDRLGEEGWIDEWSSAKPEARKAEDGKWWTWDEFAEFYGAKEAWKHWDRATSSSDDQCANASHHRSGGKCGAKAPPSAKLSF
mmetsp:Transcript_58794/g.117655  ORF Transcript_58794/g.117655 Transcript_58794/m.117655 type:complete len:222 (-) Transcript_58794:175-840(-)